MKRTTTLAALGIGGLLTVAVVSAGAWAQPGPHGPGGRGPAQMIKNLDANEDGSVTRSEADGVVSTEMGRHDGDRDGVLSLDEFEAFWVARQRERMVRRFQHLDRDGDGQVTVEEAQAPVEHLFDRLDENGDETLTREEIRDAHMKRRGHRHGRRGDCSAQ